MAASMGKRHNELVLFFIAFLLAVFRLALNQLRQSAVARGLLRAGTDTAGVLPEPRGGSRTSRVLRQFHPPPNIRNVPFFCAPP